MKNLPAFPSFRRASLSDQAAEALREAVRRRVWGYVLPGEHELARQLGISRPSVRAALSRLAADGLIEISKGRRTRLLRQPRHPPSRTAPAVCVITPAPLTGDHAVLLELRAELAVQGIGWEEVVDGSLGGKHPERRLKEIVAGRHQVCWLMLAVSAAIQRWFEQSGLPAMVLGSCFPGVSVPSIDSDYRAVGWHAAGCLARSGHRHIALILPHRPMPGDSACRDGMADYLRQMGPGFSVTELAAGPSASSLEAKLDGLLARRSTVTAIVTMRPQYSLTVFYQLLRSGRRIPEDVSVISRDTHSLLEQGMPNLTCYRTAFSKQAHRASRVVQALLAGRRVSNRPSLIIPTFVAGSTVGVCRAAF
jgi:hypothetical protein